MELNAANIQKVIELGKSVNDNAAANAEVNSQELSEAVEEVIVGVGDVMPRSLRSLT